MGNHTTNWCYIAQNAISWYKGVLLGQDPWALHVLHEGVDFPMVRPRGSIRTIQRGICPKTSAGGFTLLELLVVVTILGILVALLLPAVQAAREAARRMQCQNNLRQLGLALLGYESQWTVFPPSSCWAPGVEPNDAGQLGNLRANWGIVVLPFLEQQALYGQFDLSRPIPDSANAAARAAPLAVMLCPSDAYNRRPFLGSQSSQTAALGDNWARGNYAANAALGFMWHTADPGASPWYWAALPTSPGWNNPNLRGIMGANVSIGLTQVTDGASNTVLLSEIRAGVTDFDSRGVWAMSGACPSALWGHGGISHQDKDERFQGDDYGPNCTDPKADDVLACSEIQATFGDSDGSVLAKEGMPCYAGDYANTQQTARSMHTGGVNVCLADGSVHWLDDSIEVRPSVAGALSVWDRLMASSDGLPIAAGRW
jgi:prepilin-type N-terminal cleavage/methylation domain-containing protein/prepilin-type processing-associated H-X9-DG protein